MGQLEQLPADVQTEILGVGVERTYKRNHVVFHQGDPAGSVHVVMSGTLAVQVMIPSGAAAIVAVLGCGEVFGEMAILRQGSTRCTTVLALEDARTMMIPEPAFSEIRRRHPCIDTLLLMTLVERLDSMGQRLCEAYSEDVLHRCLLRLAELTPRTRGSTPTALTITQEHLAELVGTTRPSVNQALRRLKDRGMLSLARGRITITDPAGLHVAASR